MENLFTEIQFNNTTNLAITVQFEIPIGTEFTTVKFDPHEIKTISVKKESIKSILIKVPDRVHGVEFNFNLKDAMNLRGAFLGSMMVQFNVGDINGKANVILGLGLD